MQSDNYHKKQTVSVQNWRFFTAYTDEWSMGKYTPDSKTTSTSRHIKEKNIWET